MERVKLNPLTESTWGALWVGGQGKRLACPTLPTQEPALGRLGGREKTSDGEDRPHFVACSLWEEGGRGRGPGQETSQSEGCLQ